jgi:hypothetical protein
MGEHIVPFFLCHSLLLGCFILQRQIRLGIVYRPIKFEINNWNDFQYYHWNTLYFYCSICVYTNALTEKSKCLHIFTRGYAQTHVFKISVCKGFQWALFIASVVVVRICKGPLEYTHFLLFDTPNLRSISCLEASTLLRSDTAYSSLVSGFEPIRSCMRLSIK